MARLTRLRLVPAVLPILVKFNAVRKFLFRTVSQTLVNYRGSALSEGCAGAVCGGDRLPWVTSSGASKPRSSEGKPPAPGSPTVAGVAAGGVQVAGGAVGSDSDVRVGSGYEATKLRSYEASFPNFAPLSSLDWQIHVYGRAKSGIQQLCAQRNLPLHVFPWHPEMDHTGLERDAVYLIRPDGYVALADPAADAERVASYLDARKLRQVVAAN